MMKANDAFERSLRSSLEGYEVPYNSADWVHMEQALDGQRTGSWWASPVLYAAVLAGAMATAGAFYLLSSIEGNGAGNGQRTNGSLVERTSANPDGALADMGTEANGTTAGTGSLTEQGSDGTNSAKATPTDEQAADGPGSDKADVKANKVSSKGVPANGSMRTATAGEAGVQTPDGRVSGSSKETKGAFTASLSQGCTGASVEFNVNDMPENGIYLWNFGDGSFSNKPNPSHTYNKPGKFTVTLSVSYTGAGTIKNEPYADLIVIDEVPEAAFDHIHREYSGHVPSVHFENRSHGGATYHWDFGDGSTSTVAHPDHVYRAKGTYKVVLTVRNAAGCEDIVERQVRVDTDYNLLAPASFSPNGDGNEDLFMPQALKDLGVKFQLSIYEPASGRLVYQTGDATKPWTGRAMNTGSLCTPGEYVWMVEIKEGLHIGDISYEGKVSLVN